jgi:hypothetical protein
MYNAEAAAALEKLKDVECLVFDMDGVLVDVSQVNDPLKISGLVLRISADWVWVDVCMTRESIGYRQTVQIVKW